jgi:hypothetical protein
VRLYLKYGSRWPTILGCGRRTRGRFIVCADEVLTGFVELESALQQSCEYCGASKTMTHYHLSLYRLVHWTCSRLIARPVDETTNFWDYCPGRGSFLIVALMVYNRMRQVRNKSKNTYADNGGWIPTYSITISAHDSARTTGPD